MWLPKLIWEQVAVLWEGPPTLTPELMDLLERNPELLVQKRQPKRRLTP
jgi:hypothetical protein